jgi:murein DD-endopeptidase MepM/ murein hydrolase activator NlpD
VAGRGTSIEDPIVVAFPLRGEWRAVHTPAQRVPSHGTDLFGQRFAFDLWRTEPDRKDSFAPASALRYWTLGVSLASTYGFGEPVHAVFDGTVVHAADGMRDPGHLQPLRDIGRVIWNSLRYTFGQTDPWRFIGNHVLLQSAERPEVYAAYAHFAQGSVPVTVGSQVGTGDLVGRVGHTGNSTAPHLHFQLMDGPDPATAAGLACAFDRYEEWDGGAWRLVENGIPGFEVRTRSVPARSALDSITSEVVC